MPEFTRYAVYYAPDPGPFAAFCASWLGWDATAGTQVPHPDLPGLPLPVEEITCTPRKYGFHGTLKPPFVPTQGRAALEADLAALAARLAPVKTGPLELERIGSFLALTPTGDTSALAETAAEIVRSLDAHRTPATEAELARRRKARLSPAQEANLLQWGYPYVMEAFQFHLTLSGRLPHGMAEEVARVLEPQLAPLLPQPFALTSLCLFGEALDGRFHLLHRYRLTG